MNICYRPVEVSGAFLFFRGLDLRAVALVTAAAGTSPAAGRYVAPWRSLCFLVSLLGPARSVASLAWGPRLLWGDREVINLGD